MAEKWKRKAAQLGEELEQTGRLILHAPALVHGTECAIRFLLGAVLSGAEVFADYAPFGIGMVACSGSGPDGLCALLGACLGYLIFRGFAEGLRYAAACVLVFSVSFAFYDIRLYRTGWFMPFMASVMDAASGFVYLSDTAWRVDQVVYFSTEILLAGLSAYFYRIAFSPWKRKDENIPLSIRQMISLFLLAGTLLMALSKVTFFRDLSLGRISAVLLVMAAAYKGGLGIGAAVGVAAGLGMDLAADSSFYVMAYGFSGLLTGAGWKQGRLFAALTYVVSNAVVVLWTWDGEPRISSLYEVFIASVFFLLLPKKWMQKFSSLLVREQGTRTMQRASAYVRDKLTATSEAFQGLCEHLRSAFPAHPLNDSNPAVIFDRTANRVCRKCALRNTCWERDYISTYNALNDVLPVMIDRGKAEINDFPGWFASRCIHFSELIRVSNEELVALLYRRQYQNRVQESRMAVCRQYETLSDILAAAAAELSTELTPDPAREKRLRQHLTALGVEGETTVFYDEAGHLRVEITGDVTETLHTTEEFQKISRIMGLPLQPDRNAPAGQMILLQAEPLRARTGSAARRREGQTENGDTGTWFKRSDGSVFILLCDGMGSGSAARQESVLAIQLLEQFLRAGLETGAALRTVNSALALKNEEAGAFTTVDLLQINLFTGQGEVCKYGAAPTYIRKGESVHRVSGTALPAGLSDGDGLGPDRTKLYLDPGDRILMISDGVASPEDDQWLREMLRTFAGESPKELAQAVMEESEKRVGAADDRTAVAIWIEKRFD